MWSRSSIFWIGGQFEGERVIEDMIIDLGDWIIFSWRVEGEGFFVRGRSEDLVCRLEGGSGRHGEAYCRASN